MNPLLILTLLTVAYTSTPSAAALSTILPSDPIISYQGRHTVNESVARFDWVGTGFSIHVSVETNEEPVTISADMDGGGNRILVYVDNELVNDFVSTSDRVMWQLAQVNTTAGSEVKLIKASEGNFCGISASAIGCKGDDSGVWLFGVSIDGPDHLDLTATLQAPTPRSAMPRRFDVYGDSDSAAFCVDGDGGARGTWEILSDPMAYENFGHGWVHGVGDILSAEYHAQAMSGIGVVVNCDHGLGVAGGPYWNDTLPSFIPRTLRSVAVDDYDTRALSWVPDVVVMYIGSNDFNNPEAIQPSQEAFAQGYKDMRAAILAPFQAAAAAGNQEDTRSVVDGSSTTNTTIPTVVHLCGEEPEPPCTYVKAIAEELGEAYATNGMTDAAGCVGHFNATQQAIIAENFAPVIAAAAGWV